MSVCSVVGVIGNALVLYVFSSFKQKLTSTIFILTLATTDFITCLVTIPFTIAVEALKMKLEYDIVCK
jgi:cholecystokinin A receptor/hypocretin (orexin) receptor 2